MGLSVQDFCTGRMTLPSPNQLCQSTEGR